MESKHNETFWRFFGPEDILGVKEAPEGRPMVPTIHLGTPKAPNSQAVSVAIVVEWKEAGKEYPVQWPVYYYQ